MASAGTSGSSPAATGVPSRSMTASSRSPDPRPWRLDTASGSPRPSDHRSATCGSAAALSTLLATSSTGTWLRRRRAATAASSSVIPTLASTTNSRRSASAMARSAWATTLAWSPVALGSQPPVSTSSKRRPDQSAW